MTEIKTVQTVADNDKIWREEYHYYLMEAKRQHPNWTLKQRQEYASCSANSLFE